MAYTRGVKKRARENEREKMDGKKRVKARVRQNE